MAAGAEGTAHLVCVSQLWVLMIDESGVPACVMVPPTFTMDLPTSINVI